MTQDRRQFLHTAGLGAAATAFSGQAFSQTVPSSHKIESLRLVGNNTTEMATIRLVETADEASSTLVRFGDDGKHLEIAYDVDHATAAAAASPPPQNNPQGNRIEGLRLLSDGAEMLTLRIVETSSERGTMSLNLIDDGSKIAIVHRD